MTGEDVAVAGDLVERLRQLKAERNAVILAHNYQRGEVQDVADFVGDSLGLARQAAGTSAEVILFCGVDFMAETAAILCPGKVVIVPDLRATCPMANMISARELRELKHRHPDAVVVCYVNSSAEVKAESDICCTSANAVEVLRSLPPDREIIFVPDRSLGEYASRKAGRSVILWPGYCPTHHRIIAPFVQKAKAEHPRAQVVVHPECPSDVVSMADHVASTSGIIRYCRESDAEEFIIGTEAGILHRLRKENPEKRFYEASPFADCPNMKLNTLEKMVWALEEMRYRVTVPDPVCSAARRSIERMLGLSGRPAR